MEISDQRVERLESVNVTRLSRISGIVVEDHENVWPLAGEKTGTA